MINNESVAEVVEESEPLGQTITSISPPDDGFETYTAYKGNVGEPEWQCQIPETYYGNFDGMPWHCVFADMLKKGLEGEQLWHIEEKPQSPQKVSILIIPRQYQPSGDTQASKVFGKMMSYTTSSTTKKMDGEGDDRVKEHLGIIARVQSKNFEGYPIDFTDDGGVRAEFSGEIKDTIAFVTKSAESYLKRDDKCREFLNEVIQNLRTADPGYFSRVKLDNQGRANIVPLDVFQLINLTKNAPIVETGKSGVKVGGTNDLSVQNKTIFVNTSFITRKIEEQRFSIIHEAFHFLDGVDDFELYRAAQLADGTKEADLKTVTEGKGGLTASEVASGRFNEIVKRRCAELKSTNETRIPF